MKQNRHPLTSVHDTPATRKYRLQQRLQEISARSEQELAALLKAVEKVKSSIRSEKP